MRAIPIEHLGKSLILETKEIEMTEKTTKTKDEPSEQEFVPADPSTIIVEHNPKDPNSPTYEGDKTES